MEGQLRHATVGDETKVYVDDRQIAVIRPTGRGFGVWNLAGEYLCEGNSITLNLAWIETKLDRGELEFPRVQSIE